MWNVACWGVVCVGEELRVHVLEVRGLYPVSIRFLVGSTRLLCVGTMSMLCRVLLSCVGLVGCLGAWWLHVGRSSYVSLCECGSASCVRDGGHVAPPSYILQGVVLWGCVWGNGASQRSGRRGNVMQCGSGFRARGHLFQQRMALGPTADTRHVAGYYGCA